MRSTSLALVASLSLVFACGGDDAAGPHLAFTLPDDPAAPLAVRDNPFPSDAFKDAAGELILPVESLPFGAAANQTAIAGMSRAFEARDCFGPTAGVIFPIGGLGQTEDLDPASFDGQLSLVRLSTGEALPVESHVRTYENQLYLRAARGNILARGEAYAAIVRAGVKTSAGRALEQPGDLAAALAGDASERMSRAVRALAPLTTYLAGADIPATDVVGATVFTTCDGDAEFEAARAAAWSGDKPVVTVAQVIAAGAPLDAFLGTPAANLPGVDNEGGAAHASIGYAILGTFPAANLQSAVPGENGAWEFVDGVPTVKGHDDVPFVLVLPVTDDYANLPVVVFQHGLGGSRADVFDLAEPLAARGYAVIGIDFPFHGDRFPDKGDGEHKFGTTEGPDGMADDTGPLPGLLLFNITPRGPVEAYDPLVMTDGFRQSALDLMSLARLIVEGDLSPIGVAEPALTALGLDETGVVYSGESFGSILGLVAVAFEPTYGAGFFAVGGGGLLTDFLENSPTYSGVFMPILGGALDIEPNEVDPAVDPAHTHWGYQLFGMLLDRGDPISYGHRFRAEGKHVALALAFADEAMPNQASEAMAATIGLEWAAVAGGTAGPTQVDPGLVPVVAAPLGGNVQVGELVMTQAVFALEPATHGMITRRKGTRKYEVGFPPFVNLPGEIAVDNPIDALLTMLGDFADTYRATGVPTVGAGLPVTGP